MEAAAKKRLTVAWALVVVVTVLYVGIDRSVDGASVAVTIAAIGIALVKFRIIMREFMDVRHAPALLRRLTDALVVVIAVALSAAYFVGRAVA